ncbi:PO113 protein, partial [Eudromia elegans]|nr:PO113 protein [Eudromia elegans]
EIRPQRITLQTDITNLNDLQKLLGVINWLKKLLGVTTEMLYPLFELLKGDPNPASP